MLPFLKNNLLWTPLLLICVPIWYVVWFVTQPPRPGVMTIHCPPAICKSLKVTKEGGYPKPDWKKTSTGAVVTAIEHGPYQIKIEFVDGKKFEAGYFHADAGDRKRVDIYIDRPNTKDVHLKATGYEDNSLIEEKTVTINNNGDSNYELGSP